MAFGEDFCGSLTVSHLKHLSGGMDKALNQCCLRYQDCQRNPLKMIRGSCDNMEHKPALVEPGFKQPMDEPLCHMDEVSFPDICKRIKQPAIVKQICPIRNS